MPRVRRRTGRHRRSARRWLTVPRVRRRTGRRRRSARRTDRRRINSPASVATLPRRPRGLRIRVPGALDPRVARVQRPDLPEMTVAAETARGYLLNGRVLRPAMVTVAMAPEERGPAADV